MITVLELRQRPRLGLRPAEPRRRVLISTERLVSDPKLGGKLSEAELWLLVSRLGQSEATGTGLVITDATD